MLFLDHAGGMPVSSEQESLLRLLHSGAPASLLRRLLDSHGSADAACAAGQRDWASHGLSAEACRRVQQPEAAALAQGLCWLEDANHHLIGWREDSYPPLLRRIAAPPVMLFIAGDPTLLWRPSVAVVGSRSATPGGCANAAQFSEALAQAGFCIASGLAAGVDAAAHAATLDAGGATVAVIGAGPDVVYPARNRLLHAQIAQHGAVVSEHPPGTRPLKQFFPSRNRILAGLSLATLVVEAAQQSGALITARLAADAGREVFALPGSIHNPMARGCHRLLREGACLVEQPQEVVEALAPQVQALASALRGTLAALEGAPCGKATPPQAWLQDDPAHAVLWQALGHDPSSMDELVARTGLTAAEVSSMLLTLELEGKVAPAHGRYSRLGG